MIHKLPSLVRTGGSTPLILATLAAAALWAFPVWADWGADSSSNASSVTNGNSDQAQKPASQAPARDAMEPEVLLQDWEYTAAPRAIVAPFPVSHFRR